MRKLTRWMVVGVLVLDVVVVLGLFSGEISSLVASTQEPAHAAESTAAAEAAESSASADALRLLGQQLAERTAALDKREQELEELMRGSEVLARAGLLPEPAAVPPAEAATAASTSEAAQTGGAETSRGSAAFQTLQRAYENMEPESAARALAELAARDKAAVVQLLLGWKPRTSGAILDALTQIDAALAADLSYEIWKLDGKKET